MADKVKISVKEKKTAKAQYLEALGIDTLVAEDFVPAGVCVDMYRMQDDFGIFSRYATLGLCAEKLKYVTEIFLMADGTLDPDKEKVMLDDVANIICKLCNGEIELKTGATVKASNAAKEAFGFDYYLFDFYDHGITYKDNPVDFVMPVQIYQKEYDFIQKNGHKAFFAEYEDQVPGDEQYYFGTPRKPLKV